MSPPIDRREFLAFGAAAALAGCAVPASPQHVASLADVQAVSRVNFGSCTDQTKAQPIWDTILADRPDVFVFGGDNVYANRDFSVEGLRAAYEMEAAVPQFARFRAAVPHLAMWDDGDYGRNDGGADFPFKQEAKDEFLRFWQAPAADARRHRGGIHDARIFGPAGRRVQVILLDTRWFRSALKRTDVRDAPGKERYVPDADPSKTMLGEEQWAWLEAQLAQPAEVRLVYSGIQVIVEGHGWERWGNLPLERERLFSTIAATRANGVCLLSGDRHVGALYREERGVPYTMHELTASGFTHPWQGAKEAGHNRIGELFTEVHFGCVDIDWAARSVALQVKDIRGAVRREQRVALDALKVKS